MGMTPGRTVRSGDTPQRFTPRAGSRLPGQVRRALDGHIDSSQRNGETLGVAKDGRLEVRAAKGGGLSQTKQGLVVDPKAVGDKNHSPIERQADLVAAPGVAAISTAFNALLKELKRTGRMRG
jgi:hypothetical protein